ncbi:tricarboxylate transporter [Pseudorhizobium pelagicum]|uniref:Tricarboxylate transporter n=1 Tax=Pseudorhizobium pelagicum TaxID=1509405 RepID=A0A922NZL9_9HYPH|nr:tricarboxylate transporter [Pseudorhizobium pelagicum]KEQ04540.1 tricarboxylate transporter [Pseudorhizobium pelagicum]KEQ06700.1 tricarboxylate transporter [Pseudorhizobium pelagicum]
MDIKVTGKLAVAGVIAGLGVATIAASTATAQDLSGKTVEFVIPFAESGGSAAWANFFAPLLSKHLAGNPTVVVRYRPGAGSTEGANWFQEQTAADGSIVFGTSGSTQFPYLLGDPRVRYEYKDWKVVLSSGTGGVVYLPPELGERFDGDFDELKDEAFLYGSQGATTLDLVPLLAFKLLGLQVDPVFGVEGRGDGRLMFERGEANIDYQTSSAYLKSVVPLVEQKLAVPAFTFGALDAEGNIVRDPTFPDLPSFKEVCEATEGCETSGVGWDAWKAFFVSGFAAQKLVYLPGTASQEVVDMYSKAFSDMIAEPDFATRSEETLGVYPQGVGKAALIAHDQATTVSPEAKKYVLDWLAEDYGITMQ